MSLDTSALDGHIERLRKGETLTENEVRALCEKVRRRRLQRIENTEILAGNGGSSKALECAHGK